MNNKENEGMPERPSLWVRIAENPLIARKDKEASGMIELDRWHGDLSRELSKYYWNTGVPYISIDPDGYYAFADEMRLSFYWDKPAKKFSFENRSALFSPSERGRIRYINDPKITLENVESIRGIELGMGTFEGKKYLLKEEHIISPPFDEAIYLGTNRFEVARGDIRTGVSILSDDEREGILKKRGEYDVLHVILYEGEKKVFERVRDIQEVVALDALSLFGIDEHKIRKQDSVNTVELEFPMGPVIINMEIEGERMKIMTWDNNLNYEERQEIKKEFENRIRREGAQLHTINNYLDKNEPAILDNIGDIIYGQMEGISAKTRQFKTKLYNFQKKNNFRSLTLTSPHVSWSLPVGLVISISPLDEVYDCISPFFSTGSGELRVTAPGKFEPYYNEGNIKWKLDNEGGTIKD